MINLMSDNFYFLTIIFSLQETDSLIHIYIIFQID